MPLEESRRVLVLTDQPSSMQAPWLRLPLFWRELSELRWIETSKRLFDLPPNSLDAGIHLCLR